jgi:hypothetical protein
MLGTQHRRLYLPEVVGGVDDACELVSALDAPAGLASDQQGIVAHV